MTLDEAISLLPAIADAATLTSPSWSDTYNAQLARSEIGARISDGDTVFPILAILPSCNSADRELAVSAPRLIRAAHRIIAEGKSQRLAQKEEIRALKAELAALQAAPQQKESTKKPKSRPDHAALCAIKSQEQAFQLFLMDRKGLVDATDQLRIDSHVRKLLGVESRTELDTDPAALSRFRDLLAEFQAWSRT